MAENDVLNEEKVSAGKEELSDKKSSDLGKTILGYIDKGVESSKKGLKLPVTDLVNSATSQCIVLK